MNTISCVIVWNRRGSDTSNTRRNRGKRSRSDCAKQTRKYPATTAAAAAAATRKKMVRNKKKVGKTGAKKKEADAVARHIPPVPLFKFRRWHLLLPLLLLLLLMMMTVLERRSDTRRAGTPRTDPGPDTLCQAWRIFRHAILRCRLIKSHPPSAASQPTSLNHRPPNETPKPVKKKEKEKGRPEKKQNVSKRGEKKRRHKSLPCRSAPNHCPTLLPAGTPSFVNNSVRLSKHEPVPSLKVIRTRNKTTNSIAKVNESQTQWNTVNPTTKESLNKTTKGSSWNLIKSGENKA